MNQAIQIHRGDAFWERDPVKLDVAPGAAVKYLEDPDLTLYQGDVREVLRSLPDESVHCVVTSPPYWGLRDYGAKGSSASSPPPRSTSPTWSRCSARCGGCLRKDGTCWLNMGDSYANTGRRIRRDMAARSGIAATA